jgi:4-azaleucine resistance transporter AzlC
MTIVLFYLGISAFMSESNSAVHEFKRGALEILPLAFGAAIYGLAFGLLASQANMDALQVGVMGGIVFAGSSQIVAVERLMAGGGALLAILAGIALNLRLLLITASIRDVFKDRPFWQVALGAHLTADENWALMLSRRAKGENVGYWYLVGAGVLILVAWVVATVAGVFFASSFPEPRSIGMDFAFVAAFIAMSRSLWRGKTDIAPWLVSFGLVVVCLGVLQVDASWALIIGGIGGAATAGVQKHAG